MFVTFVRYNDNVQLCEASDRMVPRTWDHQLLLLLLYSLPYYVSGSFRPRFYKRRMSYLLRFHSDSHLLQYYRVNSRFRFPRPVTRSYVSSRRNVKKLRSRGRLLLISSRPKRVLIIILNIAANNSSRIDARLQGW